MENITETNKKLIDRIRKSDQLAFETIFNTYYSKLCVFSNSYVKSLDSSRDVVQKVFITIWDNRDKLHIQKSLEAYLYQAVRNESLDYIEKRNRNHRLKKNIKEEKARERDEHPEKFTTEELTQKIWNLVEELPERRKTIFILYRKHGLSYSEIGEVMGITRKTVENQMGKSLQFLRRQLKL